MGNEQFSWHFKHNYIPKNNVVQKELFYEIVHVINHITRSKRMTSVCHGLHKDSCVDSYSACRYNYYIPLLLIRH